MKLQIIPNEKEWQFFFVWMGEGYQSLLKLFDEILDYLVQKTNINIKIEEFGVVGTVTVYSQNDFERMHQAFQRCVR